MKNYRITVNGTAYDVAVEELGAGAAPAATAAPAPVAAAPAPAVCDDVRHRERLARAGHTEQHLLRQLQQQPQALSRLQLRCLVRS